MDERHLLCCAGADDGPALRELLYARVLAIADAACASDCPQRARERAAQFELVLRSMGSDPALTDLYERLLPSLARVQAYLVDG